MHSTRTFSRCISGVTRSFASTLRPVPPRTWPSRTGRCKRAGVRHMKSTAVAEIAFETVIEAHLLNSGYVAVHRDGFDRERALFPEVVLAFIRETQPKEWAKLE